MPVRGRNASAMSMTAVIAMRISIFFCFLFMLGLPLFLIFYFSKGKGNSKSICKSGRREIFCQGEVWKVQLYFVHHKPTKPMDWRKSSVIHRRRSI